MASNIKEEIGKMQNEPAILRDKDVFLLRVLKDTTKAETKIPKSITPSINVVAQGLSEILRRVLAARSETTPLDANCRNQIKNQLSIYWGYDEMAVEEVLLGVSKPESKQQQDCTLGATLTAIGKWANAYSKDLDRTEYFLRRKVVDLIEQSCRAIDKYAPEIAAEYGRRCRILRALAESKACKLDLDAYWLTTEPKSKRLTITEISHSCGKAAISAENPDLNHLADWKLEKTTGKKDKVNADDVKFTIKPKVFLKLNLTSDKGSLVLSTKKGVNAEWSIYNHQSQKERYAIINDASDCLLSCRDKEPLSPRLDDEDGVWIWSLKKSQTA